MKRWFEVAGGLFGFIVGYSFIAFLAIFPVIFVISAAFWICSKLFVF